MTKPAGKLKFAYETIASMESKINELKDDNNELKKVIRVLLSEPHETVLQQIYAKVFPDELAAQLVKIKQYRGINK